MRQARTLIPPPEKATKWSNWALKAMGEILEVGYDRWLEHQIEKPTHASPEWCKFILAAKGEHEAEAAARNRPKPQETAASSD